VEFHLWQIVSLVLIGLVAGVLGGLLGVGGSIIMIPGMQLVLRHNQHVYQAAAMIVNVFVAGPSAWRHYLNKVVVPAVIRWLIPTAITGVLVGVWASNRSFFAGTRTTNLAKIFAIFMAYVIAYNLFRLTLARRRLPEMDAAAVARIPRWRISVVGLAMGFCAGLLGIGGGALAVPAQQVFLRMPLKNAIGNSACTILFSALIGAIYKNATLGGPPHFLEWSDSLTLAGVLIPSAFLGGYLGAQLTHRLPREPVRVVFILMMVVAAWKMWNVQSQGPADHPAEAPASAPASPTGPPPPAGAGGPRFVVAGHAGGPDEAGPSKPR